ncbi:SDR family oxidoreductase [Krasilnikoviella flava]|uniref:NmrA-like family protein n=1 Tax=Krasilnikoviella flava TaxID=526729 RepID=A0A1T5LKN1_9MICO|nr:NmrA family NAD(P)-binding protein [Krasilnikoviella flava]SKC76028.1 NmrA-like family protein [Krasilnikoviella flava]
MGSTIAVVGGTGQAGRAVVREAVARGHAVRVVSRRRPGDLEPSPAGVAHHAADLLADDEAQVADALAAAFDGAHAVVDTSNGMTPGARATQFHEFLDLFFGRDSRLGAWSRLGLLPYPRRCRFQTIDLRDVARALVDAAEGVDPLGVVPVPGPSDALTATVGGPQVLAARDTARAWRRSHDSHRLPVGVVLPGALGEFFRAGRNLVPDAAVGTITYDQWLAEQ